MASDARRLAGTSRQYLLKARRAAAVSVGLRDERRASRSGPRRRDRRPWWDQGNRST